MPFWMDSCFSLPGANSDFATAFLFHRLDSQRLRDIVPGLLEPDLSESIRSSVGVTAYWRSRSILNALLRSLHAAYNFSRVLRSLTTIAHRPSIVVE